MDSANSTPKRQPVVLGPAEGRTYAMGRVSAVFKADGPETESRYSISEWQLEPHTQGPGAHSHPEDDIFFVTLGTMSRFAWQRVDSRSPGFVRSCAGWNSP